MAADLSRKLVKGGLLLLAGATSGYVVTALITRGWAAQAYQRNYFALWLVSAAIAHLLIAFRRRIRRAVHAMATELERMTSTGRITSLDIPSGLDVTCVTDKLNELLSLTRSQMDRLRMEMGELKIQSGLALAAKQDVEGVLFSIPEAVIVTNRFDELILANEPAEKLLGFHFEESLRRGIDEYISDSGLITLIHEARRNGTGSARQLFDHTIETDGQLQVFSATLSCIAAPDGRINGVVVVLRDVTKEKEISQMKSDFVSNVSHELKTPLASILAYVEMLVDGEASDDQTRQSFYKIISSEANRLNRLIENILNLSRIESGTVSTVCHLFNLSDVVRQVLTVTTPQATSKDVALSSELAEAPCMINADEDMVYQAAMNLLSNAIKYTPSGGKVDVDLCQHDNGQTVMFKVSDTGVGIPQDELQDVFEKFYRVKTNENLAEGTGLGLSLVKYIVETLCKGQVRVTSEVGAGSCFSVELPLVQDRQ